MGMSLGGLTVMELAVRHPALVRSLVMVDITPGRERRQDQGDHRLRRRPPGVRQLRRPARPHDGAQPDPVRVVAAARDPPQRARSSRTDRGSGATTAAAMPGRASRTHRQRTIVGDSAVTLDETDVRCRRCGTTSARSRARSPSCAARCRRWSTTTTSPRLDAGSRISPSTSSTERATACRATARSSSPPSSPR